jgi:hypothetical protein
MKKLLLFGILALVFTGTTAFILTSSGLAGLSGSPGEGNCGSCHTGGAGTTQVAFSASPAFVANQFIPGQTYTVTVNVTNNSFTKFGFDCEILTPANANAGTMTTTLTGVKFLNSGARKNAVHSTPKTGTGSAAFSFVWTAPITGTATIYATGNAINGNGSTTGDTPSAGASLALTADPSAGINESTQSGISGLVVYPNPVRSEFNISYNLLETARVKAALYDIMGKEISELNYEGQSAGAYTLSAQLPEGLPKGAYFVRLSIEGKQVAQRLIITQ